MLTIIEDKNESVCVINENGDKKIFFPDFNLNKSKELLSKFNNIQTEDGRCISELWSHNDYYLFPALQEWLYWDYFVHIVKHKDARNYIKERSCTFENLNYYRVSGLQRIYTLLNVHKRNTIIEKIIYNILSGIARGLSDPNKTILVDEGDSSFRYQNLKKVLKRNVKYSGVLKINKNILTRWDRKSLYTGHKMIFFIKNDFKFDYSKLKFLHDYITESEFYRLIGAIDYRAQEVKEEAALLEKYIQKKDLDRIITYDQIEGNLALILASKKMGIKTYGYQHGVITKQHAGLLGFCSPREYCNLVPDKIIVWGEYWKEKLIKYSNKYNQSNILVGVNPKENLYHKKDFKVTSNKKISILFPFEFLADNIKLSVYILKLIEKDFKVIIKLRPKGADGDGDMDSDFLAYNENIRKKVHFQYEISEQEIVENIDIIGCTHSTYAYEMMQYSKPIWYFETKLTFLEDIVSDKIAYLINDEVIDRISDKNFISNYLKPSYDRNRIKDVFNDADLEEFIVNEVLK